MSSAAADATSSSDDDANDAVLALVGRWRVHAIADRPATRLQCEQLGVNSDVFDVFAVPGATLKSCVVGVDVVAASSAAGAPMVAMYITANGISGEIGLRTRGELRTQPSYRLLSRSASSPDAVSWECLRAGDTHVIEWRRIGAVPDTASAPKVSPSALVRCGVLPAPTSSPSPVVRCGCGVFGCAAASAELPDDVFITVVAGLGSDREVHERCQTAKARRDKLNACVALARAHAARRLRQDAGASSSGAATKVQVSARAHLHPAAVVVLMSLHPKARRYNQLGPWDEKWMSANISTADRRFFDRVDYSLAQLEDADDTYIPNFIFSNAGVTTPSVSRKRAAAREHDQLEEVNDAVARNLADMSPEELARLHSSPQVKIISIDDEQKIIQHDRLKLALEVMTAQQRATQERAEELQAEVERLQKQLRSIQVFPERGWFSEAELHRPDRCSTQSYYFGIPGTWAGLVAVIAALFPEVKELHSPDRRSSPMTSFEQCLLAKAHLHLGWPVHVMAHQVRTREIALPSVDAFAVSAQRDAVLRFFHLSLAGQLFTV